MTLRLDVVLERVADVAEAAGLTLAPRSLAECIIMSHLARYPRVDVLEEILGDLDVISESDVRIKTSAAVSSATAIMVDCQGLPSLASIDAVLESLEAATRGHGLGLVAVRNTGGMRTLDVWVRFLARRNLFALVAWNGGPYVAVPAGGREPFFGTNPVAYGVPVANSEPIVADFATTEIAFMDLIQAKRDGTPLPVGAGLDAEGHPSTLAAEVFVEPDSARLRPIGGGPKGSALSLLLEIMTGAHVGAVMGREASPIHVPAEFGGVCIAFEPDLFRADAAFGEAVADLCSGIRASAPVQGGAAVRLPGDVAVQRWEEARRSGVPCSPQVKVRLEGLTE